MYAPGVTLGQRYRLEERIGGGGMGEVWRGTDEVLGRTVAVKVMLPSLVQEPGFAQRFHSEARAMASINHPGVVDVHDYRSEPAGAFLVMEYVAGEALAHTLRRLGRLSPARTMEVITQAAEALQAVHAKGIVHRDIKPGNLMVRDDGTVVLTDFGIARSQAATQLTATGAVIGTAPYLSPEQALGRPATPLSDLYALGVVAYQCLSGQLPFDGDSPVEVVMKHVRDEPPSLPADIPPAIRAVVRRTLAKEPPDRWRSAAELAAASRRATDPTAPAAAIGSTYAPAAPQHPPASPTTSPPPGSGYSGSASVRTPATGRAQARPPQPTAAPRSTYGSTGSAAPSLIAPASVIFSTLLLLVTAASFGVYFLAALTVFDGLADAYEDAYDQFGRDELAAIFTAVHLVKAATFLGAGFLLLLLAWLNYRGRRRARRWTINLGVLGLCLYGAGVVINKIDFAEFGAGKVSEAQRTVETKVAQALPSWYELVTAATATVGLLALLVAVVLLLTPSANRFFRGVPPRRR